MIDLVRGDINNLEGKVLVYSKITSDEGVVSNGGSPIMALYSTDDMVAFAKLFQLSKETTDKLIVEGVKIKNVLSKDANKSNNPPALLTPFYSAKISFDDEDTLFNFGHDILYMGEFRHKKSCDSVNYFGVDYYQVLYFEQKSLSHDVVNKVIVQELSANNLKSYINNKFVNPLINYSSSSKLSDKKSFDKLKDEFLVFAAGKVYDEDVLELTDIIRDYKEFQDYTLISSYIDKIDALSREDFMLAAVLRDKIKDLRK